MRGHEGELLDNYSSFPLYAHYTYSYLYSGKDTVLSGVPENGTPGGTHTVSHYAYSI